MIQVCIQFCMLKVWMKETKTKNASLFMVDSKSEKLPSSFNRKKLKTNLWIFVSFLLCCFFAKIEQIIFKKWVQHLTLIVCAQLNIFVCLFQIRELIDNTFASSFCYYSNLTFYLIVVVEEKTSEIKCFLCHNKG